MNFNNELSKSFKHVFKHSFKMVAAFAFECKEQQATSNETQTSRITKKHVLDSLTIAKVLESKKTEEVRVRTCLEQIH